MRPPWWTSRVTRVPVWIATWFACVRESGGDRTDAVFWVEETALQCRHDGRDACAVRATACVETDLGTGGRRRPVTIDRTGCPRVPRVAEQEELGQGAAVSPGRHAFEAGFDADARALGGSEIQHGPEARANTQRLARVQRREREVEHPPAPADLARRSDLHQIVPEQAPDLGGDVRIAIVESVRSRVEAKRTVRERSRVAPDFEQPASRMHADT